MVVKDGCAITFSEMELLQRATFMPPITSLQLWNVPLFSFAEVTVLRNRPQFMSNTVTMVLLDALPGT
jgi:hypothetical protein